MISVRALLVAVLAIGCKSSATTMIEEVATRARADADTIWIATEYRQLGGPSRPAMYMAISRSRGTCRRLDDKPALSPTPISTTKLPREARVGADVVVRRLAVEGETFLEVERGGQRVRRLMPPSSELQWVTGTTLVQIDRTTLLDLETGAQLEVKGDGAEPFVVLGDRLYVLGEGELVITDLHLRILERRTPELAAYSLNGDGDHHVWAGRPGDSVTWSATLIPGSGPITTANRSAARESEYVPTPWQPIAPLPADWRAPDGKTLAELDLPGPASGADGHGFLVGDGWLYLLGEGHERPRPPGLVEVPADSPEGRYLKIAGTPYQLTRAGLHRLPITLGRLLAAGPDAIITTDDHSSLIWVTPTAGGRPRAYSYVNCN